MHGNRSNWSVHDNDDDDDDYDNDDEDETYMMMMTMMMMTSHLLKVATFYVQMCDATSPVDLDTLDDYRRKLRQQAIRSAWLFSADCSERPRPHAVGQENLKPRVPLLEVPGCSAQAVQQI